MFFGKTNIEYLGFWVTRNCIRVINNKLESIVNMTPPKNTKKVCALIVLVNYYSYMWDRRSYLLQPLTAPLSDKLKFKWADFEQHILCH